MSVAVRERQLTPEVRALFAGSGASIRSFCADIRGADDGYSVLLGRESVAPGDERWHLSVAHEERLPEWADVVEIAHKLRPGVVFVIGVPPKSWWINVHEHCIHLWQLRDTNLIAQWRFEARGDTPS